MDFKELILSLEKYYFMVKITPKNFIQEQKINLFELKSNQVLNQPAREPIFG